MCRHRGMARAGNAVRACRCLWQRSLCWHSLTGFHLTRGMLCAMRRRPLPAMEAVCAGARRVAVLEEVVNPTNVGAIFRSAAA